MNWALKNFLIELAQVYQIETGTDIGDLATVAEEYVD